MPVLNLFPKMKLRNARKRWTEAKAAYDDAVERKDKRDIGSTWLALHEAHRAYLAAEAAR